MSFFSSPKTAGNAFEIIGILGIIGGIFAIIDGFIDEYAIQCHIVSNVNHPQLSLI